MTNVLPIDDIRHCPDWLRIMDAPVKAFINTGKPKVEKSKKTGRKKTGGRQFIESIVSETDENGVETARGTYKQLAALRDVAVCSIKNSRQRKTRNRATGFYYKLADQEIK